MLLSLFYHFHNNIFNRSRFIGSSPLTIFLLQSHSQMNKRTFEAFDKRLGLLMDYAAGCAKKYGMPCACRPGTCRCKSGCCKTSTQAAINSGFNNSSFPPATAAQQHQQQLPFASNVLPQTSIHQNQNGINSWNTTSMNDPNLYNAYTPGDTSSFAAAASFPGGNQRQSSMPMTYLQIQQQAALHEQQRRAQRDHQIHLLQQEHLAMMNRISSGGFHTNTSLSKSNTTNNPALQSMHPPSFVYQLQNNPVPYRDNTGGYTSRSSN